MQESKVVKKLKKNKPRLSINVPTLDEKKIIEDQPRHLRQMAPKGTELVLADGKSSDPAAPIAKKGKPA